MPNNEDSSLTREQKWQKMVNKLQSDLQKNIRTADVFDTIYAPLTTLKAGWEIDKPDFKEFIRECHTIFKENLSSEWSWQEATVPKVLEQFVIGLCAGIVLSILITGALSLIAFPLWLVGILSTSIIVGNLYHALWISLAGGVVGAALVTAMGITALIASPVDLASHRASIFIHELKESLPTPTLGSSRQF